MKATIIYDTQYKIKPRIKKRWFRPNTKVYDLIKISKGYKWSDYSYGNGWGEYLHFEDSEIIETFNTLIEAESFKEEIENFAKD